jgi:DNA-binding NtrC family response regulator
MKTILVIDPSSSIRETLRIVLGREHHVSLAPSWDLAVSPTPPALVILGLPAALRDDRAAADALVRVAPDAPVLLLNAPADVDVRELTSPGRVIDFLPKPFDAYALRTRVRALLAPSAKLRPPVATVEYYRYYLEYPFLPAALAAVARHAIAVDVPVLLSGERGTGAIEIARALHFFSGRTGPFTALAARRLDYDTLTRRLMPTTAGVVDGGTLYLEEVHETPAAVQHELLAVARGDLAPDTVLPVRIITSTSEDIEPHGTCGSLLPELVHVLGALPLPLSPLRERAADIPALVERVSTRLAARLRLESVTYTPAAVERLTHYLWFGNLAEFEAVIARTLALHRPRLVEPAHLVFFPADALGSASAPHFEPRPSLAAGAPPATASASTTRGAISLEVLLGELAHELRNPMVTVKTFAQHLDSILSDPEVRERFSILTSEAITRMDTLLETLLDFARFRAPVRRPTDLVILLDRALAEYAQELERRSVRVEHNGRGSSAVDVDEAQILFALRSLLAGLVHDLVPHEPLRVAVTDAGTLELRVRAERTIAERLTAYVEETPDNPAAETPPLPFVLASALIRRNGGALEVRSGGAGTTSITVVLPRARREEGP